MTSACAPIPTDDLIEYELTLLRPEVRASIDMLDQLIADDFFEIGANGRAFGKDEVLARLPGENAIAFDAEGFEVRRVTDDVAVVLYRAVRTVHGTSVASRRSSWWRRDAQGWRMVFHQGTPLTDLAHRGEER